MSLVDQRPEFLRGPCPCAVPYPKRGEDYHLWGETWEWKRTPHEGYWEWR